MRPDTFSRAVFLDRDGVLNQAYLDERGRPLPPRSRAEFLLLPGVVEACARLKTAGFRLICVTNQPDLARGTADADLIAWMNAEVVEACRLDKLMMCPHDDADGCECRKPLPGMLVRGAEEYGLKLSASYMIGDRSKDVEAGSAAGCRTILIDRNYPERLPKRPPDLIAHSLREAAELVLAESHRL